MNAPQIIRKKRDGEVLLPEEIAYIVGGYSKNEIPDYQMASFLMACFLNKLNAQETSYLTKTMTESGDVYDFSDIEGIKVDKHSTGGVGDKVSIPLAPILAELGFYVPMVSGRGLGHTGGTLDKLESIEGFNVNLSKKEFESVLKKNRVAMAGQTDSFVPADKKMYALRDVTATVESIPLITASIMSKKLVEGIDMLFLDVKTGSGAFMRKFEDAKELADTMYEIGELMGKRMAYIISDMSQPLGLYAGNGCEILESVGILKGEVKNSASKLIEEISLLMMKKNKVGEDDKSRKRMYEKVIESGRGYERFVNMVSLQKGNPKSLSEENLLYKKSFEITAEKDGFIAGFDTYKIGIALIYMKAGRFTKESSIDHRSGIRINRQIGDEIRKKDSIFTLYAEKDFPEAKKLLEESVIISDKRVPETKLIKLLRGV